MSVLIMAGGTGGHIMPGLALAEALRERGLRVDWLGTAAGMEARLVPQAGLPLHTISVAGVRGKGWVARLALPWMLARSVWQAWRLLRKLKPRLVFGFGGYAAAPGGLAAALAGVPLLIHEQNARAGSTNRLLARFARGVYAAYPHTFADSSRVRVVGNPVRAQILALPEPQARGVGVQQPLRLLVLGGSQGAQVLNEIVPAALAQLPKALRPQVRHQAGRTLAAAQQAYAAAGLDAAPEAFIDDMPAAYAQADLVICRAGALSLAELAAVGLAAILVPLPNAIDDHQRANAEHQVAAEGGWLLPQAELSAERLAALLGEIAAAPQQLQDKATALRASAKRQATEALRDAALEFMGDPR